jgi:hypothetical protein
MVKMIGALLAATVLGQDSASLAFRTLAVGTDSRIEGRYELVARTAGTWHLLWHKHSGRDDPPTVDAPREMAVAVFAGKSSGGESIQITRVVREGSGIAVHYRKLRAATSPAAASTTTPFHIIAVPSDGTPVTFVVDR